MDDLRDDTLEVTISLAEVEAPELGGALAVVSVRLEDGTCSLTLGSDDTTHCGLCEVVSSSLSLRREQGTRVSAYM